MEAVEEKQDNLTALERKWLEQQQNRAPTIDDVFNDEGQLDEVKLNESVRDHLPRPTGWRISLLPYRGARVTKGGIAIAEETQKKTQLATTCAYVLEVGPLAYCDESKFPDGPWCKPGDWIVFGRYAGSRIPIEGGEIRLINDDEVLATIANPEDIVHML
jgi:co-chaperonin GroES (HSP10)